METRRKAKLAVACAWIVFGSLHPATAQDIPPRPGFTSHFPSTLTYASLNQVEVPKDERGWRFEISHLDMAHGQDHFFGIKLRDKNFYYIKYELVDTTVMGSEEKQLEKVCRKQGLDPEDAYLHYSDDTLVHLGWKDFRIPGWGKGSAQTRKQARAMALFGGTLRYVYNWGDRCTHEYMMARSIRDLKEKVDGFRFDGIFVDELAAPDIPSSSPLATPIEGGHVAEFGGRTRQEIAKSGDYERAASGLYSDIARALKQATDGRSLFFLNTASWVSDGVLRFGLAADGILTEGLCGEEALYSGRGDAYLWDFAKALASKGKILIYVQQSHGYPKSKGYTRGNYRSDQERHEMYALTSYWMARQGDWVYYSEAPLWRPLYTFWIRAQEFDLGKPKADYFLWKEGVDAAGQKYRIQRREYTKAIVLFRTRFDWNDANQKNFGAPSETYKLDGWYRVVYWDGTLGPPVDRIALCLGEGVALVPSDSSSADPRQP